MDDDDIWRMIFGGIADRPAARDRYDDEVCCNRCGAEGLKWRTNDAGDWRLYEDVRIEGNRLKQHECNPASADDFEDLS